MMLVGEGTSHHLMAESGPEAVLLPAGSAGPCWSICITQAMLVCSGKATAQLPTGGFSLPPGSPDLGAHGKGIPTWGAAHGVSIFEAPLSFSFPKPQAWLSSWHGTELPLASPWLTYDARRGQPGPRAVGTVDAQRPHKEGPLTNPSVHPLLAVGPEGQPAWTSAGSHSQLHRKQERDRLLPPSGTRFPHHERGRF